MLTSSLAFGGASLQLARVLQPFVTQGLRAAATLARQAAAMPHAAVRSEPNEWYTGERVGRALGLGPAGFMASL